ncbi:twin-arginine translocase subunit TatB [Sesbania bispinosa]|nr:twin-arginine translocase subunit TatB [Sesbania bispinosa]
MDDGFEEPVSNVEVSEEPVSSVNVSGEPVANDPGQRSRRKTVPQEGLLVLIGDQ